MSIQTKTKTIVLRGVCVGLLLLGYLHASAATASEREHETAAIIVGGYGSIDGDFRNIDLVTLNAYQTFSEQGYGADDIYYLAAETANIAEDVVINGRSTVSNLDYALTDWVDGRALHTLTLFIAGGGCADGGICLDEIEGEKIDGEQLDTWFDALELSHPGIHINLIIDASYAGAFITSGVVSAANRYIVTSTGSRQTTTFSRSGLVWADTLLYEFSMHTDLFDACNQTIVALAGAGARQRPLMDTNGDGSQTTDDFAIAEQYRLFPLVHPDQGESENAPLAVSLNQLTVTTPTYAFALFLAGLMVCTVCCLSCFRHVISRFVCSVIGVDRVMYEKPQSLRSSN